MQEEYTACGMANLPLPNLGIIYLPESVWADIARDQARHAAAESLRQQREEFERRRDYSWWHSSPERPDGTGGYEGWRTVGIIQLIESGDAVAAGEYAREVATYAYASELDRRVCEYTGQHYFHDCDCSDYY